MFYRHHFMSKRIAFVILYLISTGILYSQSILWASKVVKATSTFSKKKYFPNEILGEPNCVPQGGDLATSWAPSDKKSNQSITVSFDKSIVAKQIIVVESFNPGSVNKVFAYDSKNKEQLIKTYKPGVLTTPTRILSIVLTDVMEIKAIRIVLDPKIDTAKNCIDAIGISPDTVTFKPKINLPKDLALNKKSTKLPAVVNSNLDELGPLVLADGNTIYFSRATYSDNPDDNMEQMWCSEKPKDSTWRKPYLLPFPINNGAFSFVSSITPDGNTMLLGGAFDEEGEEMSGCCSFSNRNGESWGSPENLHVKKYYNNSERVNHSLSNSGRILILAVERKDSKGERDLYVSFNEDEAWSEPISLGPTINTATDDYSPFLASDDRTLYFASSGHPSYGKSDIFITRRIGDDWQNWSKPENLGPIVNSKEDDAYFSITASGEDAYFSSSLGKNMDIYQIKLPKSQRPLPVVLLKGIVYEQKTKKPIQADVFYEDLSTGKILGKARSRSKTGEYQVTLLEGINYGFHAEVKGDLSISQNMDLTNLDVYQEKKKDLYVVKEAIGEKVRLNNLFFEYKKATMKNESFPELDRLAAHLSSNPTIKIEIQGHTDSVTTVDYNVRMLDEKTKSVVDYLVQKGIDSKRISSKVFDETKPPADKNSKRNNSSFRKIEFMILKK
jgi:OOP family OmpA-OmpF porin